MQRPLIFLTHRQSPPHFLPLPSLLSLWKQYLLAAAGQAPRRARATRRATPVKKASSSDPEPQYRGVERRKKGLLQKQKRTHKGVHTVTHSGAHTHSHKHTPSADTPPHTKSTHTQKKLSLRHSHTHTHTTESKTAAHFSFLSVPVFVVVFFLSGPAMWRLIMIWLEGKGFALRSAHPYRFVAVSLEWFAPLLPFTQPLPHCPPCPPSLLASSLVFGVPASPSAAMSCNSTPL